MRYSTPAEPISDLRAIATKAQSEIIQRREPVFMTQNADEWHMSEAWRKRLGADEDLETKQHRDSVSPACAPKRPSRRSSTTVCLTFNAFIGDAYEQFPPKHHRSSTD